MIKLYNFKIYINIYVYTLFDSISVIQMYRYQKYNISVINFNLKILIDCK